MAGRLLLPAFPGGRAMPWVLLGVSAAVLVAGFIRGDGATMAVGGVGLAGVVVGFPLARIVAGKPPPSDGADGP